jgi:hypothetical protein
MKELVIRNMQYYLVLVSIIIIQYIVFKVLFRENYKYLFLVVTGIELALIAGLRSVSVGRDSVEYCSIFYDVLNTQSIFLLKSHMEKTFLVYVQMLTYLFNSHISLFLVTAFLVVFSNIRLIWKYSEIPLLSVLIYISAVSFGYYVLSMSFLRQALAIAISFFAFDAVLKRKPLKFICLIILAMAFHKSAVVLLILYPISKIKFKLLFVFLGIAIVPIIIFSVQHIQFFFSSYLFWDLKFDSHLNLNFIIKMLFSFSILIFVYFSTRKHLNNNVYLNTLCWIMLFAFIVEIIPLTSAKMLFFNRVLYFASFYIIAIPTAIKFVNDRKLQLFISYFVFLVISINTLEFYIKRAEREYVLRYESYFTNPTINSNNYVVEINIRPL